MPDSVKPDTVVIAIGRSTAPIGEMDVASEFASSEVDLVKDVIAMVNATTGTKDGWYVVVDGVMTIPFLKVKPILETQ